MAHYQPLSDESVPHSGGVRRCSRAALVALSGCHGGQADRATITDCAEGFRARVAAR